MRRQEPKLDNPLFSLLREGRIEEFNERKAGMETCDFRGETFGGLIFRGLNARGIDFEDAYFRGADLKLISEPQIQGKYGKSAH